MLMTPREVLSWRVEGVGWGFRVLALLPGVPMLGACMEECVGNPTLCIEWESKGCWVEFRALPLLPGVPMLGACLRAWRGVSAAPCASAAPYMLGWVPSWVLCSYISTRGSCLCGWMGPYWVRSRLSSTHAKRLVVGSC